MRKLILIAIVVFFSTCKKDCSEKWSIKGRFLNGTSKKPYKNVWFNAQISDENVNGSSKDVVFVGSAITNDSGYFEIFYDCQKKIKKNISIWTSAPYSGYVRETFGFTKHSNGTYYFATEGQAKIFLKEKIPINNDTLFIGQFALDNQNNVYWKDIDTITRPIPELWKHIYRQVIGVEIILWSRKGSDFVEILKTFKPIPNNNTIKPIITGNPIINEYTIEY